MRHCLRLSNTADKGLAIFTLPSSLPYTCAHLPSLHPPHIIMSHLVISASSLHVIMIVMMLVTTESLKISTIPLSLSSVALNILLELIIALPTYLDLLYWSLSQPLILPQSCKSPRKFYQCHLLEWLFPGALWPASIWTGCFLHLAHSCLPGIFLCRDLGTSHPWPLVLESLLPRSYIFLSRFLPCFGGADPLAASWERGEGSTFF